MSEKKISIIIPAYNEEGNIVPMADRISAVLGDTRDYEIIFVDDGSSDGTLRVLQRLYEGNGRISFISFSRNFGHQAALRAGMKYAQGDCIIMMDCDLQHPPEIIPEMLSKWENGADIVYTVRDDFGKIPLMKRWSAKFFYKLINLISDIKLEYGSADFRLIDSKVADELNEMQEDSLFLRGMIPWLGFRQEKILYKPDERKWGKTKYSLGRMISFAISGITGFTTKPLRSAIYLGMSISLLAFIYGLIAVILRIFTSTLISGWTSLLVSVLFIGGLQLIILGIIGEYLGRLFMQAKGRPNYIIREKKLG